jgi:hypothetical protein
MDDPTIIEMNSNQNTSFDAKDNALMAIWIKDLLVELDDQLTESLKE